MAKFREISWSNSKKTLWQMFGGKDGQNIFHRILPATARGLTSTTAVDWHLKAKNKKCNVGLIKNYCITVSMQKISSIHKLIQQILGYHELNDHTHFWPGPPKNYWNNFLLSWICTTMRKISSFHLFILEIQPILESRDQTGHTHLAMPKIRLFHWFVLRYNWLENPAIWLAENILACISWTKISPNMEFVQELSK